MSDSSDAGLDPLQPLDTLEPLESLEGIPLSAKTRREWVQTIIGAWSLRRTKIGLAMFLALFAIAVFGRFVAPYAPDEFVGPPFSLPTVQLLARDRLPRPDVLTRVLYGGLSVLVSASQRPSSESCWGSVWA